MRTARFGRSVMVSPSRGPTETLGGSGWCMWGELQGSGRRLTVRDSDAAVEPNWSIGVGWGASRLAGEGETGDQGDGGARRGGGDGRPGAGARRARLGTDRRGRSRRDGGPRRGAGGGGR